MRMPSLLLFELPFATLIGLPMGPCLVLLGELAVVDWVRFDAARSTRERCSTTTATLSQCTHYSATVSYLND